MKLLQLTKAKKQWPSILCQNLQEIGFFFQRLTPNYHLLWLFHWMFPQSLQMSTMKWDIQCKDEYKFSLSLHRERPLFSTHFTEMPHHHAKLSTNPHVIYNQGYLTVYFASCIVFKDLLKLENNLVKNSIHQWHANVRRQNTLVKAKATNKNII